MKVVFSFPRKIFVFKEVKQVIVSLFFLFILFFPKGGLKLQGLPITWGFVIFLSVGFFLFFQRRQIFEKKALWIMGALAPFQILALSLLGFNGYVNLADTVSLLLNFYVFPCFVFLCFPQYVASGDLENMLGWMKRGVLFVAAFGIGLFFYKFFVGKFLEIPFLTVNYHDFQELEETKCIDRGGIFKLISTYNNGNLYGICILMLMPLYCFYEKNPLKKLIVKSSLVLTLSRTIWLGVFLLEIMNFFLLKRPALTKFFLCTINFSVLIGVFFGLNYFFPLSFEFIFDRFFGNRIGQLEVLKEVSFFGKEPFEGIYEVVYLGLLKSFGIAGVATFLLFFSFSLWLLFFKKMCGKEIPNYQKRAGAGLFLYLFLAGSDGAILLIPVMCFCLFLMFLLSLSLDEPNELSIADEPRKKFFL
jgi:hypothetical protein